MPFDPERDLIDWGEAAQKRREFAWEVRAQEEERRAKVTRLLSTDFDTEERLEEFITHQMKFFDFSWKEFGDEVEDFEVQDNGMKFTFQYIYWEHDDKVEIQLVWPGSYVINWQDINLYNLLNL